MANYDSTCEWHVKEETFYVSSFYFGNFYVKDYTNFKCKKSLGIASGVDLECKFIKSIKSLSQSDKPF